MIRLVQGDILRAEAEALVNSVNCVGVMGRGVALQFRKAFPENFKAYQRACEGGLLQPGTMLVHDLECLGAPRYIINFPTKRHWRGKSQISDIETGLNALVEEVHRRGIHSIAIPPLGSGLGGLSWRDVRPRIERAFAALPDVDVLLYEPAGAPTIERMVREVRAPKMTVGRAALLGLMEKYLAAVMDPFVTLLEIHKLMYFMQEAGEGLRLRFRKGKYGPYAENLRHVLSHIDGHFISGFGDAADIPDRQIHLFPEAAQMAEAFLEQHPLTRSRFDRVVDLIEGFETPFGMEVLASVHWVATHEEASGPEEAILRLSEWNPRKRKFSETHIRTAWDVMEQKSWLGITLR